MNKQERIRVFEDTKSLYNSDPFLRASIADSREKTRIIPETEKILFSGVPEYSGRADIVISRKRSFEAAEAYAKQGLHVAVHNFASATNPGGGVVNGATAQEECLCRCSTLYPCLNVNDAWNNFYGPHREAGDPLHNGDIIYTPGVTVFKTDTDIPVLMKRNDWFNVDVITCAAPNLRNKPSNQYNPADGNFKADISERELRTIHEQRLGRILSAALAGSCDVVILGAFGCGAFCNPPQVVAEAAKNVISRYLDHFKVIEFAVYCPPDDDSNFRTFSKILKTR